MNREEITLDFPTMEAFDSYIEALREGYRIGIQPAATEEDIQKILADPAAHIAALKERKQGTYKTPDGTEFAFVPHDLYWLCHKDKFIGSLSFRLELNDLLEKFGGHMGYGIRPKYEGQGMGKLMLALSKDWARKYGISRLLITCSPDNPASEKIITSNGGVHLDTTSDVYGFPGSHKRFEINL